MKKFIKKIQEIIIMAIKKIAIISAIPDEIDVFRELLRGSSTWDDKDIKIVVSGIGKAQAAAATQKVISEFQPDVLFLTGLAGSLKEDIQLGDIGIVSSAIDSEMDARAFDPSLRLGEIPFKNERVYRTSSELVKLALNSPLNIKAFDAYCASTSVFLDEAKKADFMNNIAPLLMDDEVGREPDLVDMESIGFLNACEANDIPCLILKTVSNNMKGDSSIEYSSTLLNERTRTYLELVAYIITNLPDSVK